MRAGESQLPPLLAKRDAMKKPLGMRWTLGNGVAVMMEPEPDAGCPCDPVFRYVVEFPETEINPRVQTMVVARYVAAAMLRGRLTVRPDVVRFEHRNLKGTCPHCANPRNVCGEACPESFLNYRRGA